MFLRSLNINLRTYAEIRTVILRIISWQGSKSAGCLQTLAHRDGACVGKPCWQKSEV